MVVELFVVSTLCWLVSWDGCEKLVGCIVILVWVVGILIGEVPFGVVVTEKKLVLLWGIVD